MRKAFNFYNSYWEVACELSDKDRLSFYDALMKRQFTGIESELNGMAKFAYLSQKHSIDKQIKGYLDKTKDDFINPTEPPCQDPTEGCTEPPFQQEKGQEEGKEKEQGIIDASNEAKKPKITFEDRKEKFIEWFNNRILFHKGVKGGFSILSKATQSNLKSILKNNYSAEQLNKAFSNMYNNKWVVENKMCTPTHFLVIDNFEKYLNQDSGSNNVVHTNIELN